MFEGREYEETKERHTSIQRLCMFKSSFVHKIQENAFICGVAFIR